MKEFLQENFSDLASMITAGLILFAVFFYSFIPPRYEYLGSTKADSTFTIKTTGDTTALIMFIGNTGNPFDSIKTISISNRIIDKVRFYNDTTSYPLLLSCAQHYIWAKSTNDFLERYTTKEIEEILDCFYGISNAYLQNSRDKLIYYKGWK